MEMDMAEAMTAAEHGKESLQEQEKPLEECNTMAMQTDTKDCQDSRQLVMTHLADTNKNNKQPTEDEAHTAQAPEAHQQGTETEPNKNQVEADKTPAEECHTHD